MNQILSTENNKNQKNKSPIDIKKIIIFFAIAILILGLVIGGLAIYNMYANKEGKMTAPEVTFEQIEDSVRVNINYDKGIAKIIYYWNEEDKIETVEDGKTTIQKLIDIPVGENILIIQVVDNKGQTTGYSQTFTNGEDIGTSSTIIDISLMEDGKKIKILATDEIGLQFLTYRINEGEETRVDADVTDNTSIEVIVDIEALQIERGDNEIVVVAVDKNNNQVTETKPIKGQTKPVIEAIRNGNVVECKITHDMGFEKIIFTINGQVFTYDENFAGYDKELSVFTCPIPLKEGENTLIIEAFSNEATTEEFRGRVTYTP